MFRRSCFGDSIIEDPLSCKDQSSGKVILPYVLSPLVFLGLKCSGSDMLAEGPVEGYEGSKLKMSSWGLYEALLVLGIPGMDLLLLMSQLKVGIFLVNCIVAQLVPISKLKERSRAARNKDKSSSLVSSVGGLKASLEKMRRTTEQDWIRIMQEQNKMQQDQNKMQQEKNKMQQDKNKLEQEKYKLEQQKYKLEQQRSSLRTTNCTGEARDFRFF